MSSSIVTISLLLKKSYYPRAVLLISVRMMNEHVGLMNVRSVLCPSLCHRVSCVKMKGLFAFSHRTVGAGSPDPGWHIYDADKELDRMGVLKPRRNKVASPWR